MRLLVTNDDGIWAPGICALARAMARTGHEVVVAAPNDDKSGSSAALGVLRQDDLIDAEQVHLAGLDGVPCHAVDGPPGLCVLAARLGGFGEPPDIIVSGINPGPNTGRSVLHSGTVGAAMTAANFGAKGLAVSMGVGDEYHWGTAGEMATLALEWVIEADPRCVLNVNVPNLPRHQIRGVRWAKLAPFGTVRTALMGTHEGRLEMAFTQTTGELPPDSDTALVMAGYVTVTPLAGIRAVEDERAATFMDGSILRSTA